MVCAMASKALNVDANREATFVPHDPDHVGGCHQHEGRRCSCNICGTEWPCPIRKEQRRILYGALDHLRAAGYDRAKNLPDDPASGMRWTSPIGWSVFVAYGEGNAWVTIRDPKGQPWATTTHLTVEFLEEHLP
jgi:hypothetical protein